MAKYRVVVTDDRHHTYDEERAVLSAIDAEVVVANCATPAEVIAATSDADALLCNLAPMPAKVIQNLKRCRIISRYGVGCDNVDIAAATERGIWVANVPDYCKEDVSDHTLALLLSCMRRIPLLNREVHAGRWNIASQQPIFRLQGKTYGLVGYGLIARAVHRKLQGFNLGRVLVFDPFVSDEVVRSAGAEKTTLNELFEQSDAISIHTPLNDKTRGMVGREQLSRMKPTSILINVSRGPVVDEVALVEALRAGCPMMVGLDVFSQEPPPANHPLFGMENAVLTDHAGYFSRESFSELKTKVACNIVEVLSGKAPTYPVNHPIQK